MRDLNGFRWTFYQLMEKVQRRQQQGALDPDAKGFCAGTEALDQRRRTDAERHGLGRLA